MSVVVPLGKYRTVIGNDYWVDASTGDWSQDCTTGRDRAERAIAICRADPANHAILCRMVRDMIAKGKWTGVEAGFVQRISELAVNGLDRDAST